MSSSEEERIGVLTVITQELITDCLLKKIKTFMTILLIHNTPLKSLKNLKNLIIYITVSLNAVSSSSQVWLAPTAMV